MHRHCLGNHKKYLSVYQPSVVLGGKLGDRGGRKTGAAVVAAPDMDLAATVPDDSLPFSMRARLASV